MILPLLRLEPTPETLLHVLPRMQWAGAAAMLDAARLLQAGRLDLLMVPDRGFLLVGRDGGCYIVRAILGRHLFGPSLRATIEGEARRIGCTSLALCTGVAQICRYLERRGYAAREVLPDGQTVLIKEITHGQQQLQQQNHDNHGHDDADQQQQRHAGLIGS